MWKALPRQRLWAATSRALRTPSLYERGIRVDFPPVPSASGLPLVVTVLGNPAAETETLRRRGSRIPARDRDGRVDRRHGIRRPLRPPADAGTGGSRRPVRPVTAASSSPRSSATSSRRRRAASKSRATGRRSRPGASTAATRPSISPRSLRPRVRIPPPPAKTGARRARSGSCGRRSRRALARRSTSRSSTSVRSSSSRWTPTREPTSARSGGSPAVCPPWRSARTSSTRRTPSSAAPARFCWRRRSRAAPACGCDGRSDDVHPACSRRVARRREHRAGRDAHRGARDRGRRRRRRGAGCRREGGVPLQLRQVRRVAGAARRRPHRRLHRR